MTQKEQVVEAMERCGGYATFTELNRLVDTSNWKTKTPAASIRGIVQTHPAEFYRIVPGQWGLVSMKRKIEHDGADSRNSEFTHGYYQGLLVDIGNVESYKTYVPAQDRNREYQHGTLGDFVTLPQIYEFTNERLMRKARTVDTIWFNTREMPNSFFEVEHTTDIQNSLDKFFELQDFNSRFFIVSAREKIRRFEDLIAWSRYEEIRKRVKFYDYEKLVKLHETKLAEQKCAM